MPFIVFNPEVNLLFINPSISIRIKHFGKELVRNVTFTIYLKFNMHHFSSLNLALLNLASKPPSYNIIVYVWNNIKVLVN